MSVPTDVIAAPNGRVMVVVAHFDDEALFCGGTLKQLVDRGCQIDVVVSASVTVTNQPREAPVSRESESSRQQRRLVAFGRSCGMIGVHRTFLLETHNCRARMEEEPPAVLQLIEREVRERLAPVLDEVKPDVVLTHGWRGEYGHGQHVLVHHAVRALWRGALWCFDAEGELRVPIDLPWKKRLLECYRYGTTQLNQWLPYNASADDGSQPWLGDVEHFRRM